MHDSAMPIIRLEVEGMRLAIVRAMTQHAAAMDEMVKKSVAAYCTSENLQSVISTTTQREIDRAVAEEVERFYRHGDGRKVIAEAVQRTLSQSAI